MLDTDNCTISLANNEDEVFYCQHCISIKILIIPNTINCYCGECGNTDIFETPFDVWEKLYVKEYGKKYMEQKGIQIFGNK
jgi:hypothetical protein